MSSEVSFAPCTLEVKDVIPVSTRSLAQACGRGAGDGDTSRKAVSMSVLALALTSLPVPFVTSDASCRLLSACCSLRVCLRRAWRWCSTPRALSLRRRRSGSSQHSSWPSGIANPPAGIPSTAAPLKREIDRWVDRWIGITHALHDLHATRCTHLSICLSTCLSTCTTSIPHLRSPAGARKLTRPPRACPAPARRQRWESPPLARSWRAHLGRVGMGLG